MGASDISDSGIGGFGAQGLVGFLAQGLVGFQVQGLEDLVGCQTQTWAQTFYPISSPGLGIWTCWQSDSWHTQDHGSDFHHHISQVWQGTSVNSAPGS